MESGNYALSEGSKRPGGRTILGQENSEGSQRGPAQELRREAGGTGKGPVMTEKGQESHQVDALSTQAVDMY